MRLVTVLVWVLPTLVLGLELGHAETRRAETLGVYPLTADKERALKPKDVFKECDACPQMLVAPPGRFMMGSPETEESHLDPEEPQHLVTFAQPFAVGAFAVTVDEWDACVADGGCDGYRPSDQGWGRGRRPVINVSWHDAKAYVEWLSRKTGRTYRLLSEAEREYAARAGTTTPFWWGSSISTEQANYDGKLVYGRGAKGEYRQRTVPVDSFRPNPWGLYQVHGNVLEWTEDCSNSDYNGAPSDGSAWTRGDCSRRVLRGGSWYFSPDFARSAFRVRLYSANRTNTQGFRVGRTIIP
jgi:formylglycine-generating enzyme required for sulfatase activity